MDERDPGGSGKQTAARPTAAGSGTGEAARVLRRLERIEALDRERAPAGRILGELRELVHEAEAWAQVEAGGRSQDAVGLLVGDAGEERQPAAAATLPAPERKVREEVEGMR
jgi:hypothetical protein